MSQIRFIEAEHEEICASDLCEGVLSEGSCEGVKESRYSCREKLSVRVATGD